MNIRTLILLSFPCTLLTSACDSSNPNGDQDASSDEGHDEGFGDDESGDDSQDPPMHDGYPEIQSCTLSLEKPTRFALSTTDDSTGAIGLVDIASRRIHTDLALAQTDIGLYAHGDLLFSINRFGFDYIDVLDLTDSLALLAEFSVAIDDERSGNPHGMFVTPSDEAYVALYGDDALHVFDLADLEHVEHARTVDFSEFADADGLPEASAIIPCGDTLFVAVERLDQNASWSPVDSTFLVPLDTRDDRFFDFDADGKPDGVPLLGLGVGQVRRDPQDGTGTKAWVLTSGLERVDFAQGTSEWVIDASTFEDAGFGRYQVRSFALGNDGYVYFVTAAADWSAHAIHRTAIDAPGDFELVVDGLQTTTGNLEIVGNEAWFVDTTMGSSGLRVFDLSATPVMEVAGSPFATGLPPYGLLPLP